MISYKKPITLEQAMDLIIYDPDNGEFFYRKTGHHAKYEGTNGYIRLTVLKKKLLAHRVAWLLQTGKWPEADIDHANGVKTDNRFCNLREATRQQNTANRVKRSENKSGVKGVCWNNRSQKWQAQIGIDGTNYYLGCFINFDEAVNCYQSASSLIHGEFASHVSRESRGAS